jgi:aminoglycoside phosphotransferase family enzyme/predicted kinase
MELPQLIGFLSDVAAYPYPVDAVEVRQTHISVVFLAGPYVYKVKKPVNPGFLDFSTLEQRRHFCAEEVRLNRRLAPQVYLGVVPVTRIGTGVQFEGAGDVVEWAVKMQRLPDEATLEQRLARGEFSGELVESLARRIAAFHRDAETNPRIASFGRFEAVARTIREIFAEASPQVGTTVSRAVFDRVQELVEATLARVRPLIEARAARGMPRDCHGDMHLDHIYYFPDRAPPDDLVIIDCIEFNERFRFIDPVADVAFPVMDFAFHGRRDYAQTLADAYFPYAGDDEGRTLLPLYTAYRATVRGLVEGLELGEKEVPRTERAAALTRARAHWLLALGELEEAVRKPCLVLVAGLPGTGKSVLAQGLAANASFTVIRSDVVRKELAGLLSDAPTPPELRESLYTRTWSDRTYAECLERAGRLIFAGQRVIVDANFRAERQRRPFLDAAMQWAVPSVILLCEADPLTVQQRLDSRGERVSDADWSVYRRLAAGWETIASRPVLGLYRVSTEGSRDQSLSRAMDALKQCGLC